MLKRTLLGFLLVAYVSSVSEKTYGLATIRGILSFYQDRLVALENEFGFNIDRFLDNVEKTAKAISATVGECAHAAAVPLGASLTEEAKKVLSDLDAKMEALIQKLDDMSDDDVDKLWTSVSLSGNFRTDMNTAVMTLKNGIFQKLNQFNKEVLEKCNPAANVVTMTMGRRWG
ncbi:Hypothetical protein NTJ_06369 [Nesidiocoris tenuis]|uniref:Protein TsetseEP domain-containing protein n=1 Tax=Nesidiocoris tenuis TaxID=355587 RepID=A0ABN7AMV7_9HEMI|nr:Hypothetical protein NTJ_06369 [Nesidiocoris tenuis]